jgi:hypothetical protein
MNIAQWIQSVLREIFSFKNGEGGSRIDIKNVPSMKWPYEHKMIPMGKVIPKKKSKPKTRKKLKKAA